MMGRLARTIRAIFIVCIVITLTSCEIHRAKPGGVKVPKTSYKQKTSVHVEEPKPVEVQDQEAETSRLETWIYSLISAALVGMSGIFPLMVIPIEAGPALKHGAAAARLKLLLSFAVGGLLGDVFLHLLPEAWAHLDKHGHDHFGHIRVGLWVLGGILTFLVIEKIFATEDEFEVLEDECSETETDETTENTELTQNGSIQNGSIRKRTTNNNTTKMEYDKGKKSNKEKEKGGNIRVSGYLNLAANVIDNFTHGLAVAGSYLVSTKVGLVTTVAILVHEIPHEVGDFAILLRSGFDRWKAAKAQLLTASGGLLGALSALIAESAEAAGERTAWILPFTSGGFIYIAMVTVVPDLLQERHPRESVKQILCLGSGILAMLLVTLLCE